MNPYLLMSGQLYDWSDKVGKNTDTSTAATEEEAPVQTAIRHRGTSRLVDRTIQALREARLQMFPRAGPRPQILPVGKLAEGIPANGVRPRILSRGRGEALEQLPRLPPDPRRDLGDQLRAVEAERGA